MALNELLDAPRLAQFEQVGLVDAFEFAHHRFVAKGVIAPHKPRTLFRRQTLDQGNETRQTVLGRRGGAFLYFGIEDEAYIGDPVGVERVTGPSRLDRVVADKCAGLMAIEQFDRGVAIENPARNQRFADAFA